jgi:hypothetical protein
MSEATASTFPYTRAWEHPRAVQQPRPIFKIDPEVAKAARCPMIPPEVVEARLKLMHDFILDCRDNYDCDADAHTHGTRCRACEAAKILPKYEAIG